MRIGVDARELCDRPAGKGQYLRRLVEYWQRSPEVFLVLYIRSGASLPVDLRFQPSNTRVVGVRGWGPLWHRSVAKRLRSDGVDVFFAALSYQSALWNRVPTVTVVHDLAVFKVRGIAHSRRARIVEPLTLRMAVRRSAGLIAVSSNTKADLAEVANVDPSRVTVIGEAALLSGRQDPLPFAEREAYFLFVGTLEPRKNLGSLFRAYAGLPEAIRSRYSLKLAGKAGWGEDYRAMVHRLGLADSVQFLGYVPDDQLLALYRKATVFIYPSLYEGFGLPVVEAMSVGTPVITSNCSSLPEVVGEMGLMCAATDVACLTQTMTSLVQSPDLWEEQSQYSWSRAARFDWAEIASAVLSLLLHARDHVADSH